MKAVYALFAGPEAAQRGMDALRKSSASLQFDSSQIVVVTAEPFDGYEFADSHGKNHMFGLAAVGGLLGGLAGYWLTSTTQRAYPIPTGGMPIVPPWTNGIIIYELMMLGAILTTLILLLWGARLPNFGEKISDPEIWTGKILIGVANPPESSKSELKNTLKLAGASQIKEVS